MGSLARCIAAVLVSTVAAIGNDRETIAYSIDNCPNYPNLPNHLNNTHLKRDPDTYQLTMSGTLTITEPVIAEGLWVNEKIEKCLSEETNSCSNYKTVHETNICERLEDKNKVWASTVAALKSFAPVCPIPKGEYTIVNDLINFDAIKENLGSDGYYSLEVLFSNREDDTDYPKLCVLILGKVQKKRRKRKNKPAKETERSAEAFRRALV